jgi:hypothetical protein
MCSGVGRLNLHGSEICVEMSLLSDRQSRGDPLAVLARGHCNFRLVGVEYDVVKYLQRA